LKKNLLEKTEKKDPNSETEKINIFGIVNI